MGVFLESAYTETLCALLSCLWILYWFLTKNYYYWEKMGVPYKQPEFPFGSTKDVLLGRTFLGKLHETIYKEFPDERFYGIIEFRDPCLVVRDPDLIKRVMVKDFQHFADRPKIIGNPKEYIMRHLINLEGQEWKEMRTKLSPTFTSSKMRLMFALIEKCAEQLKEHLEKEIISDEIIDVKNILSKFTIDTISSCAFGLDSNSLIDKDSKFFAMFGNIMMPTILVQAKRVLRMFIPMVIEITRVNVVSPKLTNFLTNIVRDTVEYRRKNNIKRNDFIDLLMNVGQTNNGSEEDRNVDTKTMNTSPDGLSIEQMTAQSFVFFVAGFETASSLMTFCLYELACHQRVQEKLRSEIKEVVNNNGGKLTYQSLLEIPFLDQVINETLRLCGTAQVLSRRCTQPYQIPNSDLVLEKGLQIIIPLYALHHDPQYFPEPYSFRPERFGPEESRDRHPYVFMPFGEGPRNCIGMRFGLMQVKVGLATAILNFQIDLAPGQDVPLKFDSRTITISPIKPIMLTFKKNSV